jgi:hypothetical protein
MTDDVTKESAKSGTRKSLPSGFKSTKLGRDFRIALAHSLGNRVVKTMILKQAKRPLDSIVNQLQMVNGRLHRVTRSG